MNIYPLLPKLQSSVSYDHSENSVAIAYCSQRPLYEFKLGLVMSNSDEDVGFVMRGGFKMPTRRSQTSHGAFEPMFPEI
jgi:hypothetical protein